MYGSKGLLGTCTSNSILYIILGWCVRGIKYIYLLYDIVRDRIIPAIDAVLYDRPANAFTKYYVSVSLIRA